MCFVTYWDLMMMSIRLSDVWRPSGVLNPRFVAESSDRQTLNSLCNRSYTVHKSRRLSRLL